MNRQWRAICALMSSALFRTPLALPENVDWDEALKILRKEGVVPLICDVPEVIEAAPPEIRRTLKGMAERQIFEYYRFVTAEDALREVLQGAGIAFVILKGMSSARCYPRPEYRALGDIDFLVPPEHFEAAKALLLQSGYASASEDKPGNRHFTIRKDGIDYEMHRHFSLTDSREALKRMDERIQQAAYRAELEERAGCLMPCLPRLENGLIILQHISQHIISGVTLKQVLDWVMYAAVECDDAYWHATFAEAAERYGLKELAVTVARMGQMYLGLPEDRCRWCAPADDALCRMLMEQVMDGGEEGTDFASNTVSSTLVRSRGVVGTFRNLQERGRVNWALTLQKHPYLSPFAWLYQIGRYIKRGFARENPLSSLPHDIRNANARAELYRRLGIE